MDEGQKTLLLLGLAALLIGFLIIRKKKIESSEENYNYRARQTQSSVFEGKAYNEARNLSRKYPVSYTQIMGKILTLIETYQYKRADGNPQPVSSPYSCVDTLIPHITKYLNSIFDLPDNKLDEKTLDTISHKILAQCIHGLLTEDYRYKWGTDHIGMLLYCTYVQVLNWGISSNQMTQEDAEEVKRELLSISR